MSTPAQGRSAAARDDAAVHDAAAGSHTGSTAQHGDDAAPLTSLTSLLGDSVEGGATCAADGTCD
ncbi:MAG: hypothetical protein L0H74_06645 [Brachybacterium sp.]|nr:hypothetical protein [Brachybacterium sp.]MDN5899733.1 hypothetical protein [Brachybacterium sp.]